MNRDGSPGTSSVHKPNRSGPLGQLEGRQKFVIQQVREHKEALLNICFGGLCEFRNRYNVSDRDTGELVFVANENSDCLERVCCKPNHTARIDFTLASDPESLAFQVYKPFRCMGCFNCGAKLCLGEIETLDNNGVRIGGVTEDPGCACSPTFHIVDKNEKEIGTMNGPSDCFGGICCPTALFSIRNPTNGSQIGQVRKIQPATLEGVLSTLLTTADTFEVDVPSSATLEERANFIASAMLLDYMFFEEDKNEGGKCLLFSTYCGGCVYHCTLNNNNGAGG